MATLVTEYFEPVELTDLSREVQNQQRPADTDYRLQRLYLPTEYTYDVEYRIKAGESGIPSSAKFRSWDSENAIAARPGFETVTGELLPLGLRHFITEFDRLKMRRAGEDAFRAEVAKAARDVTMATIVRLELAVAQTLMTGRTTLTNERGVTQEADWGRPASHTVVAATPWTSATSTPLTDIRNWVELWDNDGTMVMSKQTFALLATNEQFRKLASVNQVGTPDFVTNEFVNRVLEANGLPAVEIYDAKYLNDAFVETRVLPKGKILFVPSAGSKAAGATVFGVPAEALDPKYGIEEADRPGILAAHYENEHPKQTWVNAAAVAFPVLANPRKTMAATVI
ncbi:major capsid protein [Kocuria rosea]|uniref:major capsid protein n=1 Tax=Kocuria rosea TaxID=1275 RepID=UPI003D32533D